MANVLDNNASVFRPKKDEQKKIETPVIKQASIPAAVTGALRALSTGTSNITPFTKNTSASVSKPAAKTTQPSLSSQSIQNDKRKGIDWSSASPAQRAYNDTYYKTLDEPTHTKMFRDLQSFTYRTAGGADVDKSEAIRKSYKEGTTYLDNELKDYEKRYGKDSYEYKALKQFKGDYESLGRQVMSKNSAESAAHLSRQLDNTIDSVFAGYTSAPDYQAKVEKGKKEILGNPKKYGTFTLGMKGASEKQKDLLYAVFAEEGEKGAKDFYRRFLNPTVSRIGAAQEFSDTIASDSKAKRALGAAGAAVGGAVANSSILGGGVQKGIDVLTGKAKALDDDVLAGDFTVQDSVDNTLRREFAGINQADLDQYGLSGLDAMKGAHDGKKTSTGQYGLGNIDLTNRDTGLYDEDGNLMTVKSMSFEEDGKEILVPTIVKKDGKWVELSEKDAIDWYHQTGEYLGKFDTVDQANAYAQRLHQDQQQLYTDYDWLKSVEEEATDYQKQLLGYVYMASDRDEAAARDLWEAIKARDSEIRQTVNGGTYGTTSRDAVQSGLYQEYLDKNKLMLGMYKAAVTTGSQLDRVALSFIPVVGQALNLGTMGLSVFGNAYSEDVLNGREEDWKTAGHALTSAALEVVMEKLLSGVAHIPGIAVDEMSKRFVKNIANPWGRAAANTFLRFQSEGLEEGLTDAANALSTGLWFGEGDIASRAKQGFELDDVDLQQMLESYFYGGISALFLGGMTTAGEVVADINYRELGHHLNTLESTDKLIDTILNTKINEKAGKSSKKLYDEAKELAQGMKDGKLKKNDVNVGEMFANFAKSGGDVQWLTNPDTVNYNKDTLTEENFIAGATSRLAELGADTSLAGDIARWAMGQAPSQEAFNKIKSDPRAAQVLQELIDPLDMEKDNALTRAVQSTTRDVTGNKTYDTLVASNPDQTVVNPATQQLISLGVELEEAQGIGDVIAKVMSGESITEDEAELVSVSNAAVRSVLSSVANVELSEDATIGAVMDALNAVATEAADTKAKQAAVAEGAEAAARARMPIPPNTRQTITAGGIEFSHDEFIRDYMAQHNATLEQAEEAWAQRAGISAALNGEEENNGTTPGKQEGRNPDLAGRSPIPAATQRTAESGRAADAGGTEQSGRVAESGQSADLRRGYTDDQVITAFNSKQRAFMRSCLDAGFKTTKLIKGPILRRGVDKDGNPVTYEVNALVDDDGNLVIRWDNPYASPLRVALHERIHLWLNSMPDSERAAFVKQALQDIFGDNTAAFDAMYKAYADVYAKAYTGLTGEVFAAHVLEEMLADMYAGMNNYGANAGSYQSQAEMYVQQSGLREKFFGEEGGFSFDEQFSLNDPFRGDVDRSKPPETRPFPGEKAMHDNMELLSLTSMAQGANFELRLNSQGQPYELIDKKTGKRVEHVTGEMMIDTPLGNIVQLAVDNGNIDADEAAQQRDMLASAMNLIVDYDDAALVWELVGSQMFSAVKANSDKQYNKTIDFSTICKKTMAIVDAMSETMKKLGRGLTRREVEIVYEEVGKKGLATPCPVCYVFSRWMGIGGLLDQMNRFQVKYGDMSEEDIVAFMTRIEDEAWEYAKKNPKSTYFDKDAPHTRDHMLIGKVISDMKSSPNSKAAGAIETLNAHQQALATIAELEKAKEKATPAMAKRYGEMIRQLRYNVKSEKALAEAEAKMQAAEAEVEPYEEYQWLAKTMMISDSSQVNEDGESVGNWKRNPNFRPVPQDILFDLNKGGEFAKDYPLSWAFRTGKGCAAGKAIAPYSDARVGETIQGVATDVKNIRVELDESQHDSFVQDYMRKNNATREVAEEAWQNRPHNEFLTGDKKAQQQTLKSARKKQRRQNLIGGMRYQSTSDFRYEFGSDYLMTFLEMQALGANVQLYTKVIEAVDFLASTGADCNLSVMPLGDGYEEYIDPETGEKKLRLIFSNITGINADAAIKKSQEYDNVQLILVGINDTNIRLALEGDEVTFVIPFHGSGQSVHQIQTLMDLISEHLDVTQAQDYTSVQSDRAIKDRAEKHPELQAMWDLRMDIIMGKFLTEEQKETLKAWENATSQEEKTALANRLAELGKAQEGLSAEQKARLAQNKHLQKLYNMFYVDTTDPAFYNNLAKDQAEHIFPYEYWIKDGDYAHADENGRVFQEYCASIGVIPRFSGINSKYQKTGFGDFTQDKGYWKLLIDRSMYENVYDEKGDWIGYGKYRPQQQINMTNIDIGDLSRKAGEAQFTNDEMSKQYDATRNPEDLAKRDTIVSDSIKRIEAMRGSADVVERNALDRTRVKKDFREKVMKAQSALREADQTAEPESEVVELLSIADGEPKEETVVYIKDGYNDETGEAVDFINAILDGVKKGETRNHNSFPYKNWVGLAKGKADGKVYGRVKFGKPYQITRESPEYQEALIAGTNYDIPEGGSKWYYPVLEIEDFRDDPKPFRHIAQTGKYQRFSLADQDLTEKQQANVEFNNRQTEVGGELHHLSGDKQKRYKNNVGKEVNGKIFVHKQYADEVVQDPELLDNAEAALKEAYPDFEYNCITYDPKTGSIRFDEAPDFDTADEPIPGWQITVTRDGEVKKPHYESQIWHHKWQWVKNDYTGFDVEESWDRSRQYLNHLRPVDMSEHRFSTSKNSAGFAQRGIPDARAWGEQLRHFGLDDLIHDERWKREGANTSSAARLSLADVEPVEPSSDKWKRSFTDAEAREIYPKLWDTTAENGSDNPTQRDQTKSTYRKIYRILQNEGFNGKILDASSGLGVGTLIGQNEFGFDVTDIEPYPSSKRSYVWDENKKDVVKRDGVPYVPKYTDYSTHNGKYDVIISSAVLNVTPQDQRDALVVKMGEMLNPGGRMYVTTRGIADVNQLADNAQNIQLGPAEWIETTHNSYQKGFTNTELKAYLEDALGPDFTVELSNKSNGGKFNNNTSIVVTKNGAARNEAETPQERYSMVDKQFNDWAPEFYSKMERVVNDWTNSKGQPLGAKMAASQVVGWLKGKGVKSEEIKWSGIVPYLEGKKTVTKEELQQVMAENEVKIETKVLESGTGFKFLSDRDWEEVTVDSLEDLYEYAYFLADEEGFDPEYVKLYPSNDGYYITRDDTGEIIVDAIRNDAGDTRWSKYKTDLQEGFDYREILFKQPGLNYTNRAMQVHWGSEDQDGAKAEGKDVIAHVRVQDTLTPETKGSNVSVPTIFIEEIQSDLHNAGTAKQTPKNTRGFTREHAAPGFAGKLQREYQRYLDIMDGRDLNPAEQSRYDWIVKQLEPGGLAQAREAYTQAMEQRRALDEDLDQVVAEIKERTRDFQQLGLLRGKDSEIRDWVTASNPRGSFRYADESFLDSLMDGSVNEAYSFPAELIARIENIRAAYQTSRDASEDLIAANRGLSMAPPEVPFAGSSDTYHEYVMKHMLRLAAEGGYDRVAWTTAQQQSDRWSDEYAEGYKIEYDQAIPKFMNKYVKQWGGKVGTTVLDNGEEVWSVDITPEMKDSVLHEGQPRFSVAPTDKNSTPFKEGSLEATVSDLIQKADDGQALQDTINALIEKRNESLKRNNAPVIPSKDKARPVGKVQREIQQNQLQDLINKYGALKKGEKAAKDVTLPERTSDERYTRRFVRTTEEAAGIPERMNERIDDSLLTEDLLTYSRITDKMAVKKGDSDFESLGYKKAVKEWNENRAGTGHQPTKYDIAFGERLMIEAARNGDEAVALKVLADLASMETQAGQVVQAARLLKKLGPTGQLYYIQKAVDRLNKQNEGRIAKGSMQPVTIDKELAKAVILSETDKQMKDAMDELIASIAEQLPVTLKDKWDAWRYLSMLGNPRTHIRNVFGNAVFSPIRFTKDLLASAGEKMFIKDPLERTKAADARLGSKKYDAVREFAASDFEEMKQQITGTGKMNPLNEIMDKRKIFKSKAFGWLNKLSDLNSDLLEKEDAIFLRKAYIDAMTQFIAAKGLTLEQLTGSYEGGKILNDARQYAALEAQKATYRDFNQMASALNQMKRTSGVGWFIDGLMPFTKTPMNILRRGIEYSPIGLANGIYSSLVRVGKGDISAAGAIDQIAAGMTGTGIAILGYFLAKMGLARGGDDDDEKKAQLEAAEGHQNYSLEIPGYGSYTIDWMAPVALPFFVGVEVFNQLSDGGPVTGWDLANALTMIAEPMMSLSMLDGLNSTLSAVRYGDKDEAVMSVATNILTSYLSQGAPTIFGQIARTFDPDRRSTYTDKNSATPAWLQRFVQGVQGKNFINPLPGSADDKMAYVDAWGRKDTNASLFWRAVENFISPGYANRINETPVDRELTRLAESLGDTSVLPSSISKYYQLNGERLDLSAKQYEKLKTVTGQTAFSLLGNMMDDVAYIAMGDEQKAAVVKQIMSISAAIGKQAVTPDYKPDAWIQRAIDQDNLETAAVYHALKGMDTGLSDYQLISAMDWLTDEDRGTLIMEARDNTSRNMTDYAKKKYKFVLTDEQIAREREIYNDLFWPEYANLINDPKYINAGVAERADMISKMQYALGEAARRQLGDELRAAGYTSVLLDDSDVPEQVTDLYTLLNRG